MKKNTAILFIIIFLFAKNIFAEDNSVGAGIIIGQPTGISMKFWLGGGTAVDLALAWSFSSNDFMHIHGDYLFHNFNLIKVKKGRLPLYYGIGSRIRIQEDDNNKNKNNNDELIIGIRMPIGLAYIFDQIPVDIFLEIAPIVDLLPDTGLDLNGAIGARYFF